MAATAQFTFNASSDPSSAPRNNVGGTAAFDLIRLDGLGPGVPLRKGNVIPGSERVQLNSVVLKSGADYGMDYVSGVVYVERVIRPGDSLTVFYRYDDKAAQPPPTHVNGITAMRLDLVPGQFAMIAGMGMAERNPDGSLSSSNLFGFNSNFAVGGSKLNGLFLFSQKKQIQSQGLMGAPSGQTTQPTTGNSDLILQDFSTNIGKGNFSASYQDISKNFTDFGSALAAGYDAKVVDQLAKEKGLKRYNFSFNNVALGSMNVNQSFKSIKDGANELDWRSFGVKQGGLSLNFSSQYVSKGFTRFNDLSEADRAQLAREAGMSRQSISGEFAQKFGKLTFTDNSIDDGAGSSIDRKELILDSSKFKFNMGDQTVGQNFSRIGSILPAEQAMYGAQVGVHRQWMALDASLQKDVPAHFALTNLSTATGKFQSMDASISTKTYSLEHSERAAGPGFTAFGALAPDVGNQVKAIANMYQKDPIAIRPQDNQIFLSTPGIDRDFTRLTLTPKSGFNIMAQHLTIKTPTSTSGVDSASLSTKHFAFNYRKTDLGIGLDPNSLLLFERDRLGMLPGLHQTDMSLTADLGKGKNLAITSTNASLGPDDMSRGTLAYKDNKIDVQMGMRNVSPGAAFVNQLVNPDPEKNLLTSLVGYRERDV
nr:hypothetical protein [Fimbriimonadaceae bacterium]